jgi:vacuolar-type H+-ATPase subunit D/Vma8
MTRTTRVPATRSSLLRYARRLAQVQRGAALLKRKRQSLVDELFARAKTAVTSREAIETQARRAWRALWNALSSNDSRQLTPLGWPARDVGVELHVTELWGLRAAELTKRPQLVRSLAARGICPGPRELASAEAANHFESLTELLVDAAPREHAMRRLGHALAHTTRLVNTLEQRVAVRLSAELADVRRTLAEREREEHHRIKRLVARRRTADHRSQRA